MLKRTTALFFAALALASAMVCPAPARAEAYAGFFATIVRAVCTPPRMVSYVDRETGQTTIVWYGWCGVPM